MVKNILLDQLEERCETSDCASEKNVEKTASGGRDLHQICGSWRGGWRVPASLNGDGGDATTSWETGNEDR